MAEIRSLKQSKNVSAAKAKPDQKKPAKVLPDLIIKSRFVRMAPRKIRLASKPFIGKDLESALSALMFVPKRASRPLALVLKNGLARAKDKEMDKIWIKNIIVDEGPKLKRRRIIHRGRATAILKRMSHITVVLTADGNPKSQIRPLREANNPKQIANKQNPKLRK
jgi:large subunit ribosomal protein L22